MSIFLLQVLNHNFPLSVTCRIADNPLEDPEWVNTEDGFSKPVCTKKCTYDEHCTGAQVHQVLFYFTIQNF